MSIVLRSRKTQAQRAISYLRKLNTSPAGINDANGWMQRPGNLLTWSHDVSNASYGRNAGATTPNANTILLPSPGAYIGKGVKTNAAVGAKATAFGIFSGSGTVLFGIDRVGTGAYEETVQTITLTSTPMLYAVSLTIANAGQAGFEMYVMRSAGTSASSVTVDGLGIANGDITPAQILAMGGIPLTTTVASTAKYTRASLWLPGTTTLAGLLPNNYKDSTGTTPAVTDDVVGLIKDALNPTTGISLSQATAGYKPFERRGLYCLTTYSQDFSNEAWILVGGASKVGYHPTITAPDGTLSAYQVDLRAGSTDGIRRGMIVSASAYTQAYWVRTVSGTKKVRMKVWDGVTETFSPDFTLTTDWQIIPFATATALVDFALSNEVAGGAASILIYRGGLFQGTLTASDIIAKGGISLTTTAAASSTTGPQYLSFDGAEDKLVASAVPFQMSDDHCVIAGCKPLVSGKDILCGGYLNATNSAAEIRVKAAGTLSVYYVGSGTTVQLNSSTNVVGTAIVTSTRQTGNTRVGRLNGAQFATDTTALTSGAFAASVVGAYGDGSSNLAGSIYPVLTIKGTVPDDKLLLLEKLIGTLSGVTIV